MSETNNSTPFKPRSFSQSASSVVDAPKPEAAGSAQGGAARQEQALLEMDLSNAALSTMHYSGLAVSVLRGQSNTWNLSVPSNDLQWRDIADGGQQAEVTALAAGFDSKGKLVSHVAREITTLRHSGTAETVPEDAIFKLQFALTGGITRVRFIVREAATGKLCTADVDKP